VTSICSLCRMLAAAPAGFECTLGDLGGRGIVSAVKASRNGKCRGGKPFSRRALYCLLANSVYIGEIRHKQERLQRSTKGYRDCQLTLTARAENFLHGHPNLDEAIRRLQSFAEAGADVLYAPGLPRLEAIRERFLRQFPSPSTSSRA
jgi:hypothetical protein